MPTGIYRDRQEVLVDYGAYRTIISRYRYETKHYAPPFERLPTKQEFEAHGPDRLPG